MVEHDEDVFWVSAKVIETLRESSE